MNLHDQDTFLRGKNEGLEAGIQQGLQQKAIETAKALLNMSLSVQDIEKVTGLPKETILKLAKD